MEKRKWLWKRRSSERSPGETESSGSLSSKSERYSDDQDPSKVSSPPNNNTQSPEVSSKASPDSKEVTDSIKILTEKLSDALVNISAKEELVKQHSKVAEEAIAGWETCENEVVVLRQKLEAAVQQNSALEDRVNHLDGALKECVRQLRQAREEQEEKVHEAIAKSAQDWETTKSELESKLLELQAKAEAVNSEPPPEFNLDLWRKIEALEKKKADLELELELELSSQLKEMEIRTIERDLSTQAAETASKQHLEIIKKVAKLEAECRRLKTISDKSLNASSVYAESLTDSQSDSVEQVNLVQINTHKIAGLEANKEPGSSDSWASALIAELDQFKNEKAINRNLQGSTIEIDLMDDFLEMERLAALPETMSENHCLEPKAIAKQSNKDGDSLMNLEAMIHRTAELEEKLEKIEIEKAELQIALAKSHECLEASELQMRDTETKLGDLRRELYNANDAKQQLVSQLRNMKADVETMSAKINSLENEIKKERALSAEVSVNANESKKILESQLISIEADARTMSAKIVLLETEVEKERALSAQITVKCQELEEELSRKKQEAELQQNLNLNGEVKIKQEDLATAAGKLAECQKTIASLGKKLKSLATLEDFLIDTTSVPEFPTDGSSIPKAGGEPWNFRSNETSAAKRDPESPRASADKDNGNTPTSSSPSSSIVSSNHVGSEKNRNGFAKFFTRSKNGIQLEI